MLLFNLFSGVIGIGFCSTQKYLLLSLLSLEYMVLMVFFSFFLVMYNLGYELYFTLMFFLSILVSLICNQGNDYLWSVLSW